MKTLLFILAFSSSFLLYAQQSPQVQEMKKLGRDSLIKLAVKKLNEPGFDPKSYDRIIVKADSATLIVTFELSVRLVSGCYYDAVYVSIVGSGSGKSITGDCDEPKFYKLTSKDKKKIDFVFDAINKKNEIGDIPGRKLDGDETMEIAEKATYYSVEFSSYSTHSHYRINKLNGNIYDAGHKHYAHYNDERKEWEIIK